VATRRLLATICALGAALTLALPVSAAVPTNGSGTGTIGSVLVTPVRQADGNVIQKRDIAGTVSGTLSGTFVEHVRGVIHPSGQVTFEGTMTFTGAVQGCGTGTVNLGVSGQAVAGIPTSHSSVRVIDSASNTLAVHGVGTVSQTGPALTYTIQYQC
jgi:hypothetical protein